MSKGNSPMDVLQAYFEANDVLAPLLASVKLLGLLRGAFASGILTVAQRPCSPTQIATTVNMDENRVVDICNALEAHKIFVQENGHYQLADKWLVLTAPDALFLFQDVLNNAFSSTKVISNLASGADDYWTIMPKDRIALAKGATRNPASPILPALLQALYKEHVPEIHKIFEAGGRYLELGCGVGGGLLSFLQAYPTMTAVGVELATDVLEIARQSAIDLGVSDRVIFHEGNACDFHEPDGFDIVFWSQFFFPIQSRADASQVALQSLKPGGYLVAPVQSEPPVSKESLHSEAGKSYALARLIYGGWGIPAVGAKELQRELEIAGFADAKLIVVIPSVYRIVVAQRPGVGEPS